MLQADTEKSQKAAALAKQAEFDQRMTTVSIGARYQGKAWDDYQPPCTESAVALKMVRAYADTFLLRQSEGTTLLLLGNPGTGKNLLAACLCHDVVEQGHTALHTTAAKLVRRIRESWRRDGDGEASALATFTDPDLLVIDEVGMQKGTEDEAIRLFDVINERYESMQPTVIISNLNVKDLGKYLTVRTMDRLLENHILVPFTWGSYRRQPHLSIAA
jgi:DNA replication protein DnaC